LYVTPEKLGGTCRQDTVVAANRWFEEQKAIIDAEDGIKRLRPHESEYLAELERLESEKGKLCQLVSDPTMRSHVRKNFEVWETKTQEIRQILQDKSIKSLPPLDDSLRSPLLPSEKDTEISVNMEYFEQLCEDRWDDYIHNRQDNDWLIRNNYHHYDELSKLNTEALVDKLGSAMNAAAIEGYYIFDDSYWDSLDALTSFWMEETNGDQHESSIRMVVDALNFFWIRHLTWRKVKSIEATSCAKRHRQGMIDDFSRGVFSQSLKDNRLHVPKDKSLLKHIEGFLEFQGTRHKSGKITAGEFANISYAMQHYQK